MKKILMMLLVCTLALSLVFSFSSCDLFGGPDEQPGENETPTPDDETPGDETPDDGDDDLGIFDGSVNGGGGIELPTVGVNSKDMTQPESGENTDGENTEAAPEGEQ